MNTRISAEEVARASADTSLETKLSGEISTEKARIDAILAGTGSPDLENFSQVVSYINAVDTVNDDAIASHVVSINAAISSEAVARASVDASLETRISTEEVNRAAAVSTEQSRAESAESSLNTLIGSLETREDNRHNSATFTAVTSVVVSASEFPTGFDPSTGGFIQVFESTASGYEAIVAPIVIDGSGNVTITFEDSTTGLVVFYTFADDEGSLSV